MNDLNFQVTLAMNEMLSSLRANGLFGASQDQDMDAYQAISAEVLNRVRAEGTSVGFQMGKKEV